MESPRTYSFSAILPFSLDYKIIGDRYEEADVTSITVAVGQINSVVGDFRHNVKKVVEYIRCAEEQGADLIVFPELALPGYPPEDLLLRPDFIEENERALQEVVRETEGICAIVGFVRKEEHIFNSAALLCNGKVEGFYDKIFLPNYGVFDEFRYFSRGCAPLMIDYLGVKVGITICEDIWYSDGPYVEEAASGAEIIVNLSASPYHHEKWKTREKMISTRACDTKTYFVYCNMTGGQDELVFDGCSIFMNEKGIIEGRLPFFEEALACQTIERGPLFRERLLGPRMREEGERGHRGGDVKLLTIDSGTKRKAKGKSHEARIVPPLVVEEEVFKALVTGTGDYVRKNGFQKVVIGLSGGIDSSLVAAIAVKALGKENVVGVSLPSMISSQGSIDDARKLSGNLGIAFHVIPVGDLFDAFVDSLSPLFQGMEEDVTEENLQARIRGMILMAISNKFGYLVLTTGNKSEMSVGYATLYGDMAGGFAVIKDVYKTMVYRIARYINSSEEAPLIPAEVLTKPPSAELRPGQKDSDSLPDYGILDPILMDYIEDDLSPGEISEKGFDERIVREVIRMVDRNEYKRRQAPPGVKITRRALGKDRRMPITNRFSGNR